MGAEVGIALDTEVGAAVGTEFGVPVDAEIGGSELWVQKLL